MLEQNSQPRVASWLCCTLSPNLYCHLCGLKLCRSHSTLTGFEEVYNETGPCPKALDMQGHMWCSPNIDYTKLKELGL